MLASRARASVGQLVGRVHDVIEHAVGLDVVVVRRNRCHDARRFSVFLRQSRTDLGVRAFLFVVDRLADVVQKPRAPRRLDAHAKLGGHEAGDVADLDRMGEDVLRIGVAEFELAEALDQFRVHPMQAQVEHRLFPGRFADLADFLLGLLHDLFDAGRVDTAVGNQ